MTAVVELRGVSLRYASRKGGEVQALSDVDLAVAPGEIVTVVGESGCGKSSLGKMLLGLARPSAGEVLYDGQSIFAPGFRLTDALRLSVSVVHQDSYASLNPVRTVAQTLAAPLLRHRIVERRAVAGRIDEVLEQVGLTPTDYFASKLPFQLSGGQRQRVSLARAALLEPRLIIADEPVSGVDATVRLQILDLMKRLNARGIAFVYITHDLATARYLAETAGGRQGRMLVMYLGRVIEHGPVSGVLDRPSHPYLQALLAALPPLDPRAARSAPPLPLRSLDMPDPTSPPPGCAFNPRCPYVQAICERDRPEALAVEEQHFAACHFAGRLTVGTSSG